MSIGLGLGLNLTPVGGAGGGAATDPNFASVLLLAKFNGVDGATATVDSGPAVRNIQRFVGSGTLALSATRPRFGTTGSRGSGGNSVWFLDDNADFSMGAQDFTAECWVSPILASSAYGIMGQASSASAALAWRLILNTNGTVSFVVSSNGTAALATATSVATVPLDGAMTHVAGIRYNGNIYVAVNGTLSAGVSVGATALFDSTAALCIGKSVATGAGDPLPGYIDELRITKGVARYTANFTPPSAEFPTS